MKANLYVGTALTAVVLAAAYAFVSPSAPLAQERAPLLAGKVVSSTGEALAGIPVKAHRDNSAVTVAVYTDAKGEYSFPAWSELKPGAYSVSIELPDFERAAQPVALADGKAAAQLALWLTASMLFGAFAASLAAVEGGQLRDGTWNGRVLTPRPL